MDPCGHRRARHRHRRRVRGVRSRVPVSRTAAAPSPRGDVAWRAATCVVLPVGQTTGATSARDRAGGARHRDPGRHRDGEPRGARRRGLRAGHPRHTPRDRPRSTGHRRGGSRCRRTRPVHFANTSQSGVPERSNPGVVQRTHAQSQPAQTDPPFDDPTTTDQAGVAPTGGPSMLTATPTSASTIELAWSNTAGESAYRVERSTEGGATGWAQVTTIGQNVTGFTDSALSAATTYFYRVIAVRDGVDSVPSAVASAHDHPRSAGDADCSPPRRSPQPRSS